MCKQIKKIIIMTTTAILTVAVLFAAYKSYFLFLSAIVGIGMASLITPLIKKINKKFKVPKYLSAIFLLTIVGLIFLSLFYAISLVAVEQLSTLKSKAPEILSYWQGKWVILNQNFPVIKEFIGGGENEDITKNLVKFTTTLFSGLAKFGTGLTLAFVIALFTSINSEKYYNGFLGLFSEKKQKNLTTRLEHASQTIEKWFKAQVIDLLVVGFMTSLALWAFNIKYWALFGLVTCIFSFIPYIGIISVVIISTAITLVLQPDKVITLLSIYFIVQQIEANIILPKLMNKHTEIPAALLVFCLIFSGMWFGFLGVFLSAPLLAVVIGQYKINKEIKGV